MSDQIRMIEPPSEIVRVVRMAQYEIERTCDLNGIALRRMSSAAETPGRARGLNLAEDLGAILFHIFTEYDKFRTGQVEMLKKQVAELLAVTTRPVIFDPTKSDHVWPEPK